MRKRSCTLVADTVEQYTNIAVKSSSYLVPNFRPKSQVSQVPLLLPKGFSQSVFTKIEEEDDSSPNDNTNFWDDFDFGAQDVSTSASELSDVRRESEMETEDLGLTAKILNKEKEPVTRRFMVLGQSNVNSHTLINSSFKNESESDFKPLRQAMDLIVKNEEEEGLKCQFWLRALEDRRFDSLVKVYYKSTSCFIFVYSVSDRNSFNMVEQAIQEVLREVPREKFVGILLGNQVGCEEREVSYDEAAFLQEKYDLALFTETSQGDETLKEKILNPYGQFF